jgi:hypothetical protein
VKTQKKITSVNIFVIKNIPHNIYCYSISTPLSVTKTEPPAILSGMEWLYELKIYRWRKVGSLGYYNLL